MSAQAAPAPEQFGGIEGQISSSSSRRSLSAIALGALEREPLLALAEGSPDGAGLGFPGQRGNLARQCLGLRILDVQGRPWERSSGMV